MLEDLKTQANRVVGVKQSTKAVESGQARKAYVADAASPSVTEPFLKLCERQGVPCEHVDTLKNLGKACGISVGASVAVLLCD